jgi:hypothetical protein
MIPSPRVVPSLSFDSSKSLDYRDVRQGQKRKWPRLNGMSATVALAIHREE